MDIKHSKLFYLKTGLINTAQSNRAVQNSSVQYRTEQKIALLLGLKNIENLRN
jgi:hypothetical protein